MRLPQGEYDGQVLGNWRLFNGLWTGKVFTGDTVRNKIGGRLLIEGKVLSRGGVVEIEYPQLGLTDRLWRRFDRTREVWDGSMELGLIVVRFTLTKRQET